MATEFCREAAKKSSVIGDIFGGITSVLSMTPVGGVAALLGNINAKNTSETSSKVWTEDKVRAMTQVKVEQNCESKTDVNQANLVDNTECLKALGCDKIGETAVVFKNSPNAMKIYMENMKEICNQYSKNGNTRQKNSFSSVGNCKIDSMIEILTNMKLDTDVVAAIDKLMEAKGVLSGNDSITKKCDVIKKEVDIDKFVEAYQKCIMTLKANQSNTIKCAAGISQGNYAKLMNSCMISQGILVDTQVVATTKTTFLEKLKQYAEGLTVSASITSSCICIILIVICMVILSMFSGDSSNSSSA